VGSIRVFQLQIGRLSLTCSRDFAGHYVLETDAGRLVLPVEQASALANAGPRLQRRAKVAIKREEAMKEGPVFQRQLLTPDGKEAHVEIGVDGGGDAYLQIGDTRVCLDGEQGQYLLFVLARLRDDIHAIEVQAPQQADMTPSLSRAYDQRLPWWYR
jgi:hypothetical protein